MSCAQVGGPASSAGVGLRAPWVGQVMGGQDCSAALRRVAFPQWNWRLSLWVSLVLSRGVRVHRRRRGKRHQKGAAGVWGAESLVPGTSSTHQSLLLPARLSGESALKTALTSSPP